MNNKFVKPETFPILYTEGQFYRKGDYCIHSNKVPPAGLEVEYTFERKDSYGKIIYKSKIKGWARYIEVDNE